MASVTGSDIDLDLSGLRATFINCTLKRSPETRHTQGLVDASAAIMTWNLLHLARMLEDAGGVPGHGNQRTEWNAGAWFDFENPEFRS